MQRLRGIFAAALSVTLASVLLMRAPTATVLGTVVTAERAHVGHGIASIGTTVFGGGSAEHGSPRRPNSRRSSEVAAAEREQPDGKR
jgi:hypothetical protein